MSTITFDRRTVNEALQGKYSLPTYQREYKWTEKQFRELLTDLQDSFLENYKPEHGRKDVGSYSEYFLGTIITTETEAGAKSIIDGQQRLTTLTLLLAYLQRARLSGKVSAIADVDVLIRRELYGEKDYNLSFEGPRALFFNVLLNSTIEDDELAITIESIDGLDRSSAALFEMYEKIEEYLDARVVAELLPFFSDYLVNKVMLFEIGVPGEQDAHKVFVTMNDRGLKLGPIDLLKGYLLSNIKDNESNAEAHGYWVATMNSLKALSPEEDSQFLKAWFRAQFADSLRGKNRGDAPGDFEIIGESYHRWLVDNRSRLGLRTSDDFQGFIAEDLQKFAKIYMKIKEAEAGLKPAFRHVFYNGARNLTLQAMLILAAAKKEDADAILNKKIRLVATFLDLFATARVLNGQDNTYDNVRDPLFDIVLKIRRKDLGSLRAVLLSEALPYVPMIERIVDADYHAIKRQELVHILARIATHLEELTGQSNAVGFEDYVDRSRSNRTFDVEHVLSVAAAKNKASSGDAWDFSSDTAYWAARNNIGGLVLLPRSRNRSLRDKVYRDKRDAYGTENILCQSLVGAFFQNNPQVKTVFESRGLRTTGYEDFNMAAIKERGQLYANLSSEIWGISQLSVEE